MQLDLDESLGTFTATLCCQALTYKIRVVSDTPLLYPYRFSPTFPTEYVDSCPTAIIGRGVS